MDNIIVFSIQMSQGASNSPRSVTSSDGSLDDHELRKIHADHRETETAKAAAPSDVTSRHRSGSSGQSFFMSLNGDGAQRPDTLNVTSRDGGAGDGDVGATTTFAKLQMQRDGSGNRNFNNNEAAKW